MVYVDQPPVAVAPPARVARDDSGWRKFVASFGSALPRSLPSPLVAALLLSLLGLVGYRWIHDESGDSP